MASTNFTLYAMVAVGNPLSQNWAVGTGLIDAMEYLPTDIEVYVDPAATSETYALGTYMGDYFFDLYFHIWVYPQEIIVQNPRVNQDIPFKIWNAFPWTSNQLNDIIATGNTGLALDFGPPLTWKPVEVKQVNIHLTPTAPMKIDAHYIFDFADGDGFFHFVAVRTTLLNFIPEIPVQELWEFSTDIQVAHDSTETRAGLRKQPRIRQQAVYVSGTTEESQQLFDQMTSLFGGSILVPYLQYCTVLRAAVNPGDSTLVFDHTKTWLEDGCDICLFDKYNATVEIARVLALTSTGCTLTAPLSTAFRKLDLICPAFESVVFEGSKITRERTDTMLRAEINSQALPPLRTAFQRQGANVTLATFDGLAVLDRMSYEDGYNTVSGLRVDDYKVGAMEIRNYWDHSYMSSVRSYPIHRQKAGEMDYWRAFADYTNGSRIAFLLPTKRRDLNLYAAPAPLTGSITLTGQSYSLNYFPNVSTKRLVYTRASDGLVIYLKPNSVALDGGGNDILNLPTPLPAGVYSALDKVSLLLQVRIADDVFRLEHVQLDTTINFSVRTTDQ